MDDDWLARWWFMRPKSQALVVREQWRREGRGVRGCLLASSSAPSVDGRDVDCLLEKRIFWKL